VAPRRRKRHSGPLSIVIARPKEDRVREEGNISTRTRAPEESHRSEISRRCFTRARGSLDFLRGLARDTD
jgi:hypothetical protein